MFFRLLAIVGTLAAGTVHVILSAITFALAVLLLPLYIVVAPTRAAIRFGLQAFWSWTIHTFALRLCMQIRVSRTYDVAVSVPTTHRPLVLTGVHQGHLLHPTMGLVYLQLARSFVHLIVKHDLEWMARLPLKHLGMGVLINRENGDQAREALVHAVRFEPKAAFAIMPEGIRACEAQIARQIKKYGLEWQTRTGVPKSGGLFKMISTFRDTPGVPRPRILFIAHRTKTPDWTVFDFPALVGTTVDVHVADITDRILKCKTQDTLTDELNDIFEVVTEWMEHRKVALVL